MTQPLKDRDKHQTIVRLALSEDSDVIAEYTRNMALETEHLSLNSKVVLKGVQSVFKNPQYGFYVVAIREHSIAGCMMVTYEWSDWRDGVQWWLQSVYVHPEFRRMGIFNSMYEFVLSKASQNENVCGIRLYVDKSNEAAKHTYEALGMNPANYLVYEISLRNS